MKTFSNLEALLKDLIPDLESVSRPKAASGAGVSGIGSQPELCSVTLKNGTCLDLFLKVVEDDSVPAMHNKSAKTVDKELAFYEKVLPEMVAFQRRLGIQPGSEFDLEKMTLKYFGCGQIEATDDAKAKLILAFEDFASTFAVVGKTDLQTEAQIDACSKAMAIFHAVSFAMLKANKGFGVEEPLTFFEDFIYSANFKDTYGAWHLDMNTKMLKRLAKAKKDSEDVKRLQKLTPKIYDAMRFCRGAENCDNELLVFCHGDFHMWNVAFDKQGQGRVKLFDFQVMCFGSPMAEMHYYLG